MPIYHKTPPPSSTVGNHNTAEIDYHTSEAAKVKRTREQAYFNSYDFDAIKVLPYDDDDEEDEGDGVDKGKSKQRERERRQLKIIQTRQHQFHQQKQKQQQHQHQQQHQQKPQQQHIKPQQTLNQSFKSVNSSRNNFMVDNLQPNHHPLHQNSSVYLQNISKLFSAKPNNSNKFQLKENQQQQQKQPQKQHHNHCNCSDCCISGVGNALSHDNKHLKMSSSETSSTSLTSSSIVQEILNNDKNVAAVSDVIATACGILPLDCARDVMVAGARTYDTTKMDVKAVGMVTTIAATTAVPVASTNTASVASATAAAAANGGNFLLPRAMLKYQSSALNTQQGATGITTGITNSMPLATNANSSSSNSSPTNIRRQRQLQQQQQQKIILNTVRDVHKLDGIGGKNAMIPTIGSNVSLRLQKTSSSSSVITSLASEDIEEDIDLEESGDVQRSKLKSHEKKLNKVINTKASVRASSHQSHYSTDKSASSGYYSSNVCSTYSLDEHIYSEPTLDLKRLRNNVRDIKLPSASSNVVTVTPPAAATLQTNNKLQQRKQHHQQQQQQQQTNETNSVMHSLDINRRYRYAEKDLKTPAANRNSQEFSENLKILETSIENLDRHLKSFPGVNPQDALVNYAHVPSNAYASVNHSDKIRSSSSSHNQLPTIQESIDAVKKQTWPEDRSDDSLMDIDLDSFLLDKDQNVGHKPKQASNKTGVDNPTFLTDEQEENHYKCAKYINSCPEDAYRVESDIIAPARSSISGQSVAASVDLYPKRYEEQLHFQNTRELLEDVRDKIRLLTQSQDDDDQEIQDSNEVDNEHCIPKELHSMINTLKHELELYLERMNQHSELEIRQLCAGLLKNQHIVKMKNAFERRRSLAEANDSYATYEALQDGTVTNAHQVTAPISIRQQITSIRCSSDPNFKMKRKSIAEVFPLADYYVETLHTTNNLSSTSKSPNKTTQLQKNLSYHKPVLEQLNIANTMVNMKEVNSRSGSGRGDTSTSEPNDKESILEWHRKKPSIWEMYYGTNRIQQSLLGGKKNGMMMVASGSASSPSTMCYPSSRPESDFTLDLPRAEQLRIKMEKEKKFRHRCRVITTFLSLIFFLLTVMVVSLVLTRGKRMFGSMI